MWLNTLLAVRIQSFSPEASSVWGGEVLPDRDRLARPERFAYPPMRPPAPRPWDPELKTPRDPFRWPADAAQELPRRPVLSPGVLKELREALSAAIAQHQEPL